MNRIYHNRHPLGFIVEGHGEYNAFPTMVVKILGCRLFVPIANAGGCGAITNNLSQQLYDFLLIYNSQFLYICIDLIDVIKANQFSNCSELLTHLQNEIHHFETHIYPYHPNLKPLPDKIGVIIQIPKFESWMLSDFSSLAVNQYIDPTLTQIQDVDNQIPNPSSWIINNFTDTGFDPKNPMSAKRLLSVLDPTVMRTNSFSYDKYFREIESSYKNWLSDCGFS
jgi:hypothetical protein